MKQPIVVNNWQFENAEDLLNILSDEYYPEKVAAILTSVISKYTILFINDLATKGNEKSKCIEMVNELEMLNRINDAIKQIKSHRIDCK